MKSKNLFTIVMVLLSLTTIAQTSGKVVYEESIKLTIDLPPEFADMIPKERSTKKQLIFTSEESVFKNLPKEENAAAEEIASQQGNVMIKMKVTGSENVTYRNLSTNEVVEQREFFGRTFRIKDARKKIAWKVSGEQKKIAGYTCMKATHMRNDTIPVTAWFTAEIPIQNGPDSYGDLPGLILALDVDNGARTTRALSVDLRPLTADEKIEIPEKGKEVTRKKFEKIQKEKMAEMEEMGGGNRVIIRHN